MKAGNETGLLALAKGQLWKVKHVYFQIVEPGTRVTQYKILTKPDQQAALTRLLRKDVLLLYLKLNAATLVS